MLCINEFGAYREDGKVFCKSRRVTCNMLFEQHTKFAFQNYNVVKECIIRLSPVDCRHNFDLKPKCLTWRCSDFENCPFVLEIVPFVKRTGKTESELKNGRYCIRKAQNHDHIPETLWNQVPEIRVSPNTTNWRRSAMMSKER